MALLHAFGEMEALPHVFNITKEVTLLHNFSSMERNALSYKAYKMTRYAIVGWAKR